MGVGVYYPDTILLNAPDMFSMENAKHEADHVSVVYYYNDARIYKENGVRYMTNNFFGNQSDPFEMQVSKSKFILIDSKGCKATYTK